MIEVDVKKVVGLVVVYLFSWSLMWPVRESVCRGINPVLTALREPVRPEAACQQHFSLNTGCQL